MHIEEREPFGTIEHNPFGSSQNLETSAAPVIPEDPADFLRTLVHAEPDPKQEQFLRSTARKIILCMGRRCGKTWITAAKAAHFALRNPHTTTLVFSISLEQSYEVLNYIRAFLDDAGIQFKGHSTRCRYIHLPNHSRIVAIPASIERRVRGYTPHLVIIDEAAQISDDVYHAITPMLGLNKAALILLSTPGATQGFFYQNWISDEPWDRYRATTLDCPRYDKEHIEFERRNMPEYKFRRELLCEFQQVDGACFPDNQITRAFVDDTFQSLPRWSTKRDIFIGVDLGQLRNHSAFIVLDRIEALTDEIDPITRSRHPYCEYRVLHCERVPLDTPYPTIGEMLFALGRRYPEGQFIIDAGAAGVPIIEHLRFHLPKRSIQAIQITSGASGSFSGDFQRIPKRDVIASVQLMLQTASLKLSRKIPQTDLLKEELRMFRHRYTKRNADLFTAPEGEQDDLVMALALAANKAWKNM